MSLSSAQFIVDGTAVKLAESNGSPIEVHVHSASGSIYLGDSTVTTSTGYRIDNGDKALFMLADHTALYAISAAGNQTVYVLRTIV